MKSFPYLHKRAFGELSTFRNFRNNTAASTARLAYSTHLLLSFRGYIQMPILHWKIRSGSYQSLNSTRDRYTDQNTFFISTVKADCRSDLWPSDPFYLFMTNSSSSVFQRQAELFLSLRSGDSTSFDPGVYSMPLLDFLTPHTPLCQILCTILFPVFMR